MVLPWLTQRRKSIPELVVEPPLPLGNRSNGEYFHEQTPHERRIRDLVLCEADRQARRCGLDRREFLASSVGMATALAAIDACRPEGPSIGPGNGYDLGPSDGCEPLDPPEFVLDVQTHHVDPEGAWRETNPGYADLLGGLPQAACGPDPLECYSAQAYVDLVFLDSDTSVAVLSGLPASACASAGAGVCGEPLDDRQVAATRELINALGRSPRSVNHAMVTPNVDLPRQLEQMQQMVEELGVAGFKLYPPWGPKGEGYWLDDPAVGIPVIEQARSLGVRTICVHKGLPLPGFDRVHTDPRDVVAVAKMYPDMDFIVYHSAWLHGGPGNGEGPYDPEGRIDPGNPERYPVTMGVSSLVHAMQQQGLPPGSNVYADLGSVWTNVLALPDQAAHVLGKLLLHLGEGNVLWGTDSVFTGSPQPLIEAFRAFRISEQFQATYGYPALDDARKRKILGLNAAPLFGVDPEAVRCELDRDAIGRRKQALDEALGPRRWAIKAGLGPRTRREFARLLAHSRGPT
jgi:predicted TIM-barrel fold metal-dependent hydrolase